MWSLVLWLTVPKLFWWFSPVLAGLLLAIPLSAWSSRPWIGDWARRHGLFLIPEERAPPPILRQFQRELQRGSARPWAVPGDGLGRVLEDPEVRTIHLSLLPSPAEEAGELEAHDLRGLRLKARHGGLGALTAPEKRKLLLDAPSIHALLASEHGNYSCRRGQSL